MRRSRTRRASVVCKRRMESWIYAILPSLINSTRSPFSCVTRKIVYKRLYLTATHPFFLLHRKRGTYLLLNLSLSSNPRSRPCGRAPRSISRLHRSTQDDACANRHPSRLSSLSAATIAIMRHSERRRVCAAVEPVGHPSCANDGWNLGFMPYYQA